MEKKIHVLEHSTTTFAFVTGTDINLMMMTIRYAQKVSKIIYHSVATQTKLNVSMMSNASNDCLLYVQFRTCAHRIFIVSTVWIWFWVIPYRTKKCRTKVTKFFFQKWRKFCLTKNYDRRKFYPTFFCPIKYSLWLLVWRTCNCSTCDLSARTKKIPSQVFHTTYYV